MKEAVEKGIDFEKLKELKSKEAIARMATTPNEEWEKRFRQIEKEMEEEIKNLMRG